MKPKTCTQDEFWELTVKLANEIQDVHFDYRLFRDLNETLDEHEQVALYVPEFWNRTLDAFQSIFLLRLCRIFDVVPKALGLHVWLTTIAAHPEWFEEKAFRARCKPNYKGKPDQAILAADTSNVSKKDVDVKSLIMVRGSILAHTSSSDHLQRLVGKSATLTYQQIETLLERSRTILNRYCGFFKGESWTTATYPGQTEYEMVIQAVQEKLGRMSKD